MRVAFVCTVLVLAAGCGSAPPLYATQAPAQTVVDGAVSEWPAALRPVPRESGLSIGLRVEGNDLVLALIAGDDRQARRIALGGVRVWIDPMGGDDRVLGLRYPATDEPSRMDIVRSEARRETARRGDADRLRQRFEDGRAEVEVTRGVVTQNVAPTGAGFEAAAEWGPANLVVEMRIPLTATTGLLELDAGPEIGVGVELLDVQRPRVRPSADPSATRPRGQTASGALERRDFEPTTLTRWLRIERG